MSILYENEKLINLGWGQCNLMESNLAIHDTWTELGNSGLMKRSFINCEKHYQDVPIS